MARRELAQMAVSLIFLGLFLIGGGLVAMASRGGPVTCDGQVMGSGDTCVTYAHGRESRRESYQERQDSARSAAAEDPWMVAGGVAAVVVGVLMGRGAQGPSRRRNGPTR